MEVLEETIKDFLIFGNGCGCGYSDGDGNGCGYSNGYGYGEYKDISMFNGNKVYIIDNIPTIIKSVKGAFAKGFIFNKDMMLMSCYVVKSQGLFAHGKTIKEAYQALQEKLLEDMPVEERIEKFLKEFKMGVKYPNKHFFDWHHILTGSCLFGRQQFCKNKRIDLEGKMTVEQFIKLTENDYGGDIIKKLKREYENG